MSSFSAARGPANGLTVDLAGGTVKYAAPPDLTVNSPSTGPVVFQRLWRSTLAANGAGSPGLSVGWAHSYDVKLVPGEPDAWSPLSLVRPSGTADTLTIELAGGTPTGRLVAPVGSAYLAAGQPSTVIGQWDHVEITDTAQNVQRFELHSSGVYVLVSLTNRVGKALRFVWDSERRLQSVTDVAAATTLLTATYAGGYLGRVTDSSGRHVDYRHGLSQAGACTVLLEASGIASADELHPLPAVRYDYLEVPKLQAPNLGTLLPLLSAVSIPSPTGEGWATTQVQYYDEQYLAAGMVDANGIRQAYAYADGATVVSIFAADNAYVDEWTVSYNADGLQTGSTCSGCPSLSAYDDPNNPKRPSSVTTPDGKLTSYTYDTFGNLLSRSDARGVVQTYTYDYSSFALGRLVSEQRTADGITRTLAAYTYYEPSGLVQTETTLKPGSTDGSTVTTTYTYDGLGNIVSVVAPGNDAVSSRTTTLNYTTDGDYTRSARRGQPLLVTDNLGHATHLRYDDRGNRTEATDAAGHTWLAQYNLADQLVRSQLPDDEAVDLVVDGDLTPLLTASLARLGQPGAVLAVTATAYLRPWPAGQPEPGEQLALSLAHLVSGPADKDEIALSAALPSGRHRLDAVVLSIVTGAGTWDEQNRWTVGLEARDQALAVADHLGDGEVTAAGTQLLRLPAQPWAAEAVYLYPGGPQVEARALDRNGLVTQRVLSRYGLEGELLEVSGDTTPMTYEYDALYRKVGVTDGGGNTTRFAYDTKGRLKLVRHPRATADEGFDTLRYTLRDDAGRLLQRIDGNGVVTEYDYLEAGGALTAIRFPANPSQNVTMSHDALGRRIGMANAEATLAYSYGDDGLLLSATATYPAMSAQTVSYTYHDDGSRATLTTPAGLHTCHYDAAGRLSELSWPLGTAQWEWSDDDRLLQQTLPNGATTEYSYNAAGQLVGQVDHDPGGSIAAAYGQFGYAGSTQLETFSASVPQAPSLSGTTLFAADPLRQLIGSSVGGSAGEAAQYRYDAAGNPLLFRGETGTFNSDNQATGSSYVYDGAGSPTLYDGQALTFGPSGRLTSCAAFTAGYRPDGLLAWVQPDGGARTYYVYDDRQRVAEIAADGSLVAGTTYGVAGLLVSGSSQYQFNPLGDAAVRYVGSSQVDHLLFDPWGRQLAGQEQQLGYRARVGYHRLPGTSWIAMAYRMYDAEAGRFLTRDPAGHSGGVNLYAYGHNDPVNSVDPLGLWPNAFPWFLITWPMDWLRWPFGPTYPGPGSPGAPPVPSPVAPPGGDPLGSLPDPIRESIESCNGMNDPLIAPVESCCTSIAGLMALLGDSKVSISKPGLVSGTSKMFQDCQGACEAAYNRGITAWHRLVEESIASCMMHCGTSGDAREYLEDLLKEGGLNLLQGIFVGL